MKSAVLEKPATVKFVCPAGYNLQLVIDSIGRGKEVDGHFVPDRAHSINFRKEGYLPEGARVGTGFWRGVFVTSNPKEIEFIRNHEWFRYGPPPEPKYENGLPVNESAGGTSRLIYEVSYDSKEKPKPGPELVKRFDEDEENPKEPDAPVDVPPAPVKAKVSKGLKRG